MNQPCIIFKLVIYGPPGLIPILSKVVFSTCFLICLICLLCLTACAFVLLPVLTPPAVQASPLKRFQSGEKVLTSKSCIVNSKMKAETHTNIHPHSHKSSDFNLEPLTCDDKEYKYVGESSGTRSTWLPPSRHLCLLCKLKLVVYIPTLKQLWNEKAMMR